MTAHFRKMTAAERLLIEKLLDVDIPHRDEFVRQAQIATVRPLDEFGSLAIQAETAETADAVTGPIVSAMQSDADTVEEYGPYIQFILFASDGFLSELQIYKDDGTLPIATVDPGRIVRIWNSMPP